jgi:hypothetical protein
LVVSVVKMTLPEFHEALKAQGVGEHQDLAFRCVMCGTIQSGRSLIAAGAGKSWEEVERFVGFSCVGRFTNAGPYKRGTPPGSGCNWTLGGLFRLHKLEVVDEEGKSHPRFEIATPAEAQALSEKLRAAQVAA